MDDPRRLDVAVRFWNKVHISENEEGCWEWQGSKVPFGYGRFRIPKDRAVYAHRWSYEYIYGPIPNGLQILHQCDNPPCVRPDHLFLGTQSDNMRDSLDKGRLTAAILTKNHAKLTEDQVREIRERYSKGNITQTELAKEYPIGPSSVSHIITGFTWKHVR